MLLFTIDMVDENMIISFQIYGIILNKVNPNGLNTLSLNNKNFYNVNNKF